MPFYSLKSPKRVSWERKVPRYLLRLPSDSFFITGKSGKYITFSGIGFGHGLGMSQWGAYVMAQEGKSYREILSFYYPHTKLEYIRLSPTILEWRF
jgi:SpoIID/LytB domain protein